jgi:ribosomal protein S18 acetylase RimI-like enzyme
MARRDIETVLGLWWSSFIADKDLVASQLGGRRDLSLVAQVEGHLVGFVLARIEYLGIPISEVCFMHAIAVNPDYRKQGIGSQLISQLKSRCDSKRVPTMRAVVPQDNRELLNYFERLGFSRSNIVNLDQRVGGKA